MKTFFVLTLFKRSLYLFSCCFSTSATPANFLAISSNPSFFSLSCHIYYELIIEGLLSRTNKSVEDTYKFKIKAKNSDLNISAESEKITLTIIHIPNKTHISLTLGLSLGLGIPLILGIAFIIWYFTHKRKTKVKI